MVRSGRARQKAPIVTVWARLQSRLRMPTAAGASGRGSSSSRRAVPGSQDKATSAPTGRAVSPTGPVICR